MGKVRQADVRSARDVGVTAQLAGGRKFRSMYAWANAYELSIGLAAMLVAVILVINRDALQDTSIHKQAGLLVYAWGAMYGFGGLLVTAGVLGASLRGAWRAELAGLCLLTSGMAINAVSVAAAGGSTRWVTYVALAAASAARIRVLLLLIGATHLPEGGGASAEGGAG